MIKKTLLEVINIWIPDDPNCVLMNIDIYLFIYVLACLWFI